MHSLQKYLIFSELAANLQPTKDRAIIGRHPLFREGFGSMWDTLSGILAIIAIILVTIDKFYWSGAAKDSMQAQINMLQSHVQQLRDAQPAGMMATIKSLRDWANELQEEKLRLEADHEANKPRLAAIAELEKGLQEHKIDLEALAKDFDGFLERHVNKVVDDMAADYAADMYRD